VDGADTDTGQHGIANCELWAGKWKRYHLFIPCFLWSLANLQTS
jgi:hypothetical protein